MSKIIEFTRIKKETFAITGVVSKIQLDVNGLSDIYTPYAEFIFEEIEDKIWVTIRCEIGNFRHSITVAKIDIYSESKEMRRSFYEEKERFVDEAMQEITSHKDIMNEVMRGVNDVLRIVQNEMLEK